MRAQYRGPSMVADECADEVQAGCPAHPSEREDSHLVRSRNRVLGEEARKSQKAAHRRGRRDRHMLAAGVNVCAVARPVLRVRTLNARLKRRPFSSVKLHPCSLSIIPIALAALLSTIAVQPAGNGRLLAQLEVIPPQCPATCRGGACNMSLGARQRRTAEGLGYDPWDEDVFDDEQPPQHAADSLLLNPNFVALIVRSTLILLEFGSRPLKNAKKMLSCGLICYWLYHYRFGSDASIIANRSVVLDKCPNLCLDF